MLLDKFYTLVHTDSVDQVINARILINRDHPIFLGHFPDVPVVPGVCMIQIIKEIVEHQERSDFRLVAGDNIKFLSVLNPDEHPAVEIRIELEREDNNLPVTAALFAGEVTFLKLKAVLEKRT